MQNSSHWACSDHRSGDFEGHDEVEPRRTHSHMRFSCGAYQWRWLTKQQQSSRDQQLGTHFNIVEEELTSNDG